VRLLKRVWAEWIDLSRYIGDFQAKLILTIVYFTLFVPFGVGLRLLGDPLGQRRHRHTAWVGRSTPDSDLAGLRRQY
jgi:hypothetical protein